MLRVPPAPAPNPPRRLDHGIDDGGVASHSEIVVRAPDDDLTRGIFAAPGGIGRALGVPLEIGEHPVTALAMDSVEERMKMIVQRHHVFPRYLEQGLRILPRPRCGPRQYSLQFRLLRPSRCANSRIIETAMIGNSRTLRINGSFGMRSAIRRSLARTVAARRVAARRVAG